MKFLCILQTTFTDLGKPGAHVPKHAEEAIGGGIEIVSTGITGTAGTSGNPDTVIHTRVVAVSRSCIS